MKKGRENGFCWKKQEYKRKIWKKNVAGFPKREKSFLFENKTAVLENGGDRGEDKEEK